MHKEHQPHQVVPLAGTWIETSHRRQESDTDTVVPLAGTWIETSGWDEEMAKGYGRSPCGNVD